MTKQLLPIDIQSFRTLREDNCYYLDKTSLISQLISEGDYYFLSRPRRFGKSLLLDTINELFSCSEELFQGLDIHDQWDWEKPHPVLRLSFDAKYNEPEDLAKNIESQLASIESNMNIEPLREDMTGPGRLHSLLYSMHRKTGRQVVVLVDEYDKPFLDNLDIPDLAKANRDYLFGCYGVLKGCAEHIRFTLLTGVSVLTNASIFSGVNHLRDISLYPRYANLCGFTDHDLDTVFAPELEGLARDEIRHRYNGYSWLGDEKLYNPWDILMLFSAREYQDYWFDSGSPTMLYRQILREHVNPLSLRNTEVGDETVSRFDVGDVDLLALMFQSGYLTIVGEQRKYDWSYYTLDYPNEAVRQSFSEGLFTHIGLDLRSVTEDSLALLSLLEANDFDGFGEALHTFIAGIPQQWYDTCGIEVYEAHFASMLYVAFQSIGAGLFVVDSSSRERSSLVFFRGGQVFILEFKMAENRVGAESSIDDAMAQMQERGYADKYQVGNEPIHLVAMLFGRGDRNLIAIQAEQT